MSKPRRTKEQVQIAKAQAQIAKAQAVLNAAHQAKVLYAKDGYTQMGEVSKSPLGLSIKLNDTGHTVIHITIETLEKWVKQAKVAQEKGYV